MLATKKFPEVVPHHHISFEHEEGKIAALLSGDTAAKNIFRILSIGLGSTQYCSNVLDLRSRSLSH